MKYWNPVDFVCFSILFWHFSSITILGSAKVTQKFSFIDDITSWFQRYFSVSFLYGSRWSHSKTLHSHSDHIRDVLEIIFNALLFTFNLILFMATKNKSASFETNRSARTRRGNWWNDENFWAEELKIKTLKHCATFNKSHWDHVGREKPAITID
jgi:hypothetical protein